MAGLFTAIGAVGEILGVAKKISEKPDTAGVELDNLRKKLRIITSDGSITKFLSSFIVEPVVIVSKGARETEVADKLVVLNTDIFSSFYTQAFYALANLHGFDPIIAINILGTDNSSFQNAIITKGIEFAKESNKDYFRELIKSNSKYLSFSTENKKSYHTGSSIIGTMWGSGMDEFWELYGRCDKSQREYMDELIVNYIEIYERQFGEYIDTSDLQAARKKAENGLGSGLKEEDFKKYASAIISVNNKSGYNYQAWKAGKEPAPKPKDPIKLGYVDPTVSKNQAENLYYVNHRDLNLTMEVKDKNGVSSRTIIIPITVKTHIIVTSTDNILNMLKPNDKTKKFGYRLDEWRSGAISLRELIFCGDLIQSYKKNKLKDKDGLINIIKKREESANSKIISSEMIGFEKFYNMLIVTAEEKVLLNKHIGGDILNEKYKQELLTEAHALTLSVVDQDYERVYILTKDIRGKSDVTFKSINKSNNKNSDLEGIVKALMSNRPPVF